MCVRLSVPGMLTDIENNYSPVNGLCGALTNRYKSGGHSMMVQSVDAAF